MTRGFAAWPRRVPAAAALAALVATGATAASHLTGGGGGLTDPSATNGVPSNPPSAEALSDLRDAGRRARTDGRLSQSGGSGGWHICNRSQADEILVTVILSIDKTLVSSGWHPVGPGQCWVSEEKAEVGYYFATAAPGVNWAGPHDFCVSRKNRTGPIPEACPAGFQVLPFRRVTIDKSTVFSSLSDTNGG